MFGHSHLNALYRVNQMMMAAGRQINAGQVSALLAIAMAERAGKQLTQVALARSLGIGEATTGRYVRYLSDGDKAGGLGLACTRTNPEDAREKFVLLTPRGRDLLNRVEELLTEPLVSLS